MPSLLAIAASVVVLYFSSLAYRLVKNLYHAQNSGFAYVIVPWEQNALFWVVAQIPLRPWLRKHLPKWAWDRWSLTIYGFEFTELMRPYEQFVSPRHPSKSYVLVTTGLWELSTADPELATEILRRPNDFQQAETASRLLAKFGPNVLTTDGEVWARHRKVVASVINERISKAVFQESAVQTRGLLSEVVGEKDAAETNRLFDMVKKVTVNVLSGAGMGAPVAWREQGTPQKGFQTTYISAVQTVLDGIGGPLILPRWFLSNYPRSLPGYDYIQTLSLAIAEFPKHTTALLDREREKLTQPGERASTSIMSQMLQAIEHDNDARSLSEEDLVGNLFIFTAAGFETSANSLSFALILLARFPQWQQWVLEEIDAILPSSDTIEYASIFPQATRVMAVMLETLRLYPPVVHIVKMPRKPQVLKTSTKTYHVPAGATLYVGTVALHRDPKVWRNLNLGPGEEPRDDDEHVFRPSRWLTSDQKLYQAPRGSYVAWSAGPRVCPGQKMSQVEFTSIFLHLFKAHRIEGVLLPGESTAQMQHRFDQLLAGSYPLLALQMHGIYNVDQPGTPGVNLRVRRRKQSS